MNTLPNAHLAIVPIEKLRDYSLNADHRRGRDKARVFRSALGLTADDAEWLAEAIHRELAKSPVKSMQKNEYGQRFQVEFNVARAGRTALVRTGWILPGGEIAPRLTTCFVVV